MDKFNLKNKTILITGASSGIGRACAVEISQMGANCILVGRNLAELQKTKELCLNHTTIILADLTNDTEIKKIITEVYQINGIVHSAGIISPKPIKFLKTENIREIFEINFNAPVLLTSALLQGNKIANESSIVFLSSISSKFPYFGGAVYVSSKAALEAFSKTLAIEVSQRKIRSNVLQPGLVETQMLDKTKQAAGDKNFAIYENKYPLGFGKPEDVANAVCFLLSNEAKWITGSELKMDGGLLINGMSK